MNRSTAAPLPLKRNRSARVQGLIAGLVVFALLILADQLPIHYGLNASQRILDDICGGAIAGLLVFFYERGRSRYVTQQLQTIALMNHHVRNALQVIAYSSHVPPDEKQILRMKDAVKRIEWALREVLPGQVLDFDKDWKQPPDAERPDGLSASA
jgi:hypothetical protein